MQGTKIGSRLIFAMGLSFMLSLYGCSGGGGGGGGVPATGSAVNSTDQATISANFAAALSTENLVDIHNNTSSNYNADCVSCHGTKSDGEALDGRHDAHAIMMPWTPGSTTNDRCVWCHKRINLEFRNPSGNTYTDGYSNYRDTNPVSSSSNQFNTVRLDTNIYEGGVLRHEHDPLLCLQCHSLGKEFEFYAD